jgi:hypothetical protein
MLDQASPGKAFLGYIRPYLARLVQVKTGQFSLGEVRTC